MNRSAITGVLVLAVLAAIVVIGGTPAALGQESNATSQQPGDSLSSAIATQGETVDESVAVADFRARFAAAETPTARARVIAAALNRSERRTGALENRLETLQTERTNGSIGDETYTNRVTPVIARARSLDRLVDGLQRTSEDVNDEALRETEVTPERFETLQSRIDDVLRAETGANTRDGLAPAFYRNIASLVTTYNEKADNHDLGVLGAQTSGERINLQIDRTDGGTSVISFRTTGDNRVRELRAGPRPDATLRVGIDESTAREIIDDENSDTAAREAFADGEITIDGLGYYNAIKFTIAKLILEFVRLLVGVSEWLGSLI